MSVHDEFQNLVGKRMLFKVEVSPHRDMRFERTIPIRKIAIDERVMGGSSLMLMLMRCQ